MSVFARVSILVFGAYKLSTLHIYEACVEACTLHSEILGFFHSLFHHHVSVIKENISTRASQLTVFLLSSKNVERFIRMQVK